MLSRLRSSRLLRVLLALVALAFVGYGLVTNWNETAASIARLSWWSVAGACATVMAGAGLMLVAWRRVIAGLGSHLPIRVAARVLFVGQLGKYVPGSVWAYAAMMELGRDHGCPPKRTFSGTSLGLVISLGCAVALAAATLPFTARSVAEQAWYLVFLIPVIIICLHPRILTWGLNLALRIARKDPLEEVLAGRALLDVTAWTMAGWLVYGLHLWLVMGDLTGDFSLFLLGAGAYAFAWATGLLTVIVPAGIGVREGAMVLVLAPAIGTGNAFVAAAISRLAFTFTDVAWAGAGFLLGRRAQEEKVRVSTYAAQ